MTQSVGASAPAAGVQPTTASAPQAGSARQAAQGAGNGVKFVGAAPFAFRADTTMAMGALVILMVMVLPLPPILLDLLLALSVSLALLIFLFSLHIERPLEFSVFPSILLIATLFRLALNVASTRLILLGGEQGPSAAGAVIEAFGSFVVGGNTVVGLVVFLILVLINFVVITKGAGRIAEVGARFTLDAMPGKQMAVDADLASGLIDETEAKQRRARLEQEADFFGAMDGASKFVRGDAIAGLLITAVNIIGGFAVGMAQKGMGAGQALSSYTSLTVGDGLVSQIPALLTSVAAGLVTTRAAAGGALGNTIKSQLFGSRRPILIAGGVLMAFALVPGMPHLPFFVLAVTLLIVGWRMPESDAAEAQQPQEDAVELPTPEKEKAELERMLPVELLEMEVGYELVPMVDQQRDGSLMRRISGVRKQLAENLGIIVPPIHMRDNLRLRPGAYRVKLAGQTVGEGELRNGKLLVMDPGRDRIDLPGQAVTEPAFGLPAKWVAEAERERAELAGYTVVDPSTVAATHLGELLGKHAYELLGRAEAKTLLDAHRQELSSVIDELFPEPLGMGPFVTILRNLLSERVSIRDFRTILEALADKIRETTDTDTLTEAVRQRLARQLTRAVAADDGSVYALVLAPNTENIFRKLQGSAGGRLDPNELQNAARAFERALGSWTAAQPTPLVLTAGDIRKTVSVFCARHFPELAVMSFREVLPDTDVRTVAVVGEHGGAELKRGEA